jgi:ABC-type dipeptide/oligopeptide/nickel transport system ATPase subunit
MADEMTAMFDIYTQAQVWKVVVEYVRENKLRRWLGEEKR